MKKAVSIAALLLLASCAKVGTPDIRIADAWARETVTGQSGTAGYATIENRGDDDDRLLSVSAAPPAAATLHETSTKNGISSMRPIENGLEIPAGGNVVLKPGGAHVMIMGLTGPLHLGETLKLTLRFERSGKKAVDFRIAPAMSGMSR